MGDVERDGVPPKENVVPMAIKCTGDECVRVSVLTVLLLEALFLWSSMYNNKRRIKKETGRIIGEFFSLCLCALW